ncbi:hypothetical protein [Eubacterium barkeri]|uniref:Uncharacterized protein n=1 Tax=Eubacterium barkeri TaxID=1528 RepID=A0A1H3BJZ4_EUBBA|nr:hypothetical protein [Eubacterium barkeri]SDX42280.1 hypothetical protein SAMN04488579_102110 [Eubacterium barkeri]
MAENSFIFTSNAIQKDDGTIQYDRAVNAEEIRMMVGSIIGNGVLASSSSNLKVHKSNGSNMKVAVKPGLAWINGAFYYNEASKEFTLDTGDGVNPRIDTVVLRLSLTNRAINVLITKGTPSESPSAETPTRNTDTHDLVLAQIYIPKGATSISESNITDMRFDKNQCGIVTGAIDQIDTTDLFTQFNAAFNVWFNQAKGTLTEDAAGNLLNLYNALKESTDNIIAELDQKIDLHVQSVVNEKDMLKQIIRVRMSGDIVRGWNKDGIIDSIPFRDTHRGGMKKTDWGELLSDGKVRIDKDGEYFVGLIAHISDCPGSQGTFHVGVTETKSSLIVAENYVHTSTYNSMHICSGTPSNRFRFYAGDVIKAFIVPPNGSGGYRLDKKQTTLTVEPLWFD